MTEPINNEILEARLRCLRSAERFLDQLPELGPRLARCGSKQEATMLLSTHLGTEDYENQFILDLRISSITDYCAQDRAEEIRDIERHIAGLQND